VLSQLQKKNRRLKNELENKKQFINMVIHDLRNPTSHINFALSYAMENLEKAKERLQEGANYQQSQFSQWKKQMLLKFIQFEKQIQH